MGDEFIIHPEVPLIAKLFVKVPDTKIWLTNPPPAGFLRWEGPTVLPTDPMIRVDLISSTNNGPERLLEVNGERSLRFTNFAQEIIISSVDDSKLSSALVFFVGNYFVTFFFIGLIAAGISLVNKPKPLRISEVSEAFLSYISFSRLE